MNGSDINKRSHDPFCMQFIQVVYRKVKHWKSLYNQHQISSCQKSVGTFLALSWLHFQNYIIELYSFGQNYKAIIMCTSRNKLFCAKHCRADVNTGDSLSSSSLFKELDSQGKMSWKFNINKLAKLCLC